MTTRRRLDLLARAFPQLFPRTALIRLLRSELGHVDALDAWISRDGVRVRARAPRLIYHVCAGNLAVSAWTSIAHGLLLGARNVVKLPSDPEDAPTRREIVAFLAKLPPALRALVKTSQNFESATLHEADVVVAFGTDATMESLRAQIRPGQKFIAHGHAVSLLWLADPNRFTPHQARACAVDILTYDQTGCLSPQAIYLPRRKVDVAAVARRFADALEAQWRATKPKPKRPLSVAARISEARDLAHALGHGVWLPPSGHLGWTLIHDPAPAFQPSPLHGVIYLRQVEESALVTALAPVAGLISTVGVAGTSSQNISAAEKSSRWREAFLNLGVTRFCAAGRMQFPPLTWHHDGHRPLSELVTWIDDEGAL